MAPLFTGLKMGGFGKNPDVATGPVAPFSATGGTVSTPGDGYKYHVFTTSNNFVTTNSSTGNIEFVILGGGGGGGHGGDASAGGGGSGGLVYGIVPSGLSSGSYPVSIGNGGPTANNGTNTTISLTSTVVALGGGAGQSRPGSGPLSQSGGSGGGGSMFTSPTSGAPGTQPSQNPAIPLVNTQYGNPGAPGSGSTRGGQGGSANATNNGSGTISFPNGSTILSGSPVGASIGWGGYGTDDSYGDGTPQHPPAIYGGGGWGGRNAGGSGIPGVCVIRYLA